MAFSQWRNSVIAETRGSSPHKQVSMFDLNALSFVFSLQAAKQESGGQSQ